MNILKITNHLRECSLYETETGSIPVDLKSLGHLAEAIEQHHKDLMGLVEAWRSTRMTYGESYRDGYINSACDCADNLESLINPKD